MMEWPGDACFTLLVFLTSKKKYQFPIGLRNEFVHITSERRKVVIQKLASGKVLKILTTLVALLFKYNTLEVLLTIRHF